MRRTVAFGLMVLLWHPAAWAEGCRFLAVVSDTIGGTRSDIADGPARVCSVEFYAAHTLAANNVASAWVFDSPDDTESHAQATTVTEPGSATAGSWSSGWFGNWGRPTRHGLDVLVKNGQAVIAWDTDR